MIKLSICFFLLLFAFDVNGQEESTTNCTYEVTQVFKDNVLVSETKVRKCKEETKDTNKFDPDNNFKDYVKVRLVDVAIIATLVKIAGD